MRPVTLALTLALASGLTGLPAGPLASTLAAQERVEERERRAPQDTLPRDTVLRDTLILQPEPPTLGYDPAAFSLELTIGVPGSGEAQRQPATVLRTDIEGTVLDSAVLTRTLSVRGGATAAVSGVIGLGRDWAARLGVGLTTARVEAGFGGAGTDSLLVGTANAVPGTRADLTLLTVETGLHYRIPSRKRLQPYLELGAAYARWHARSAPDALQDDLGSRFEATAGVGGVIPLDQRFSVRFRASTRVFRTPVLPRAAGDTLGTRIEPGWPPTRKEAYRRTVLVAEGPTRSPFADGALELLSLLRLQLGVSWDLRAPRTPAVDGYTPGG